MRGDDICFYLGPTDRAQMEGLCANRDTPRKVVWRTEIVLATADGSGTSEIMRRAETSKPTVWRWQERYLDEGMAGLRLAGDEGLAQSQAAADQETAIVPLPDLKVSPSVGEISSGKDYDNFSGTINVYKKTYSNICEK